MLLIGLGIWFVVGYLAFRDSVERANARLERITRAADPVLAECYAVVERLLPRPLADYQSAVEELNAALERALAELERSGTARERQAEGRVRR